MILHLLRCQGIAVGYYSFTFGRLEAASSSTLATSGGTEISKALGINAATGSKAVMPGRKLPEVDKIHKQLLDNRFLVITPHKNNTSKIGDK